MSVEIQSVQRYGLSNHLNWMLTGQPGGQGKFDEVLAPEVEQAYAAALIRADLADTLWAAGASPAIKHSP